jgi:hypothetical protein
LNSSPTTLLDRAVQSIDSPVGGNLFDPAPFLADDLFQIIICHCIIVDNDLPRSR